MRSKLVGMGLATLALMGGGCHSGTTSASATSNAVATVEPYSIDLVSGSRYEFGVWHVTDRKTGKVHVMASFTGGRNESWVKIDEFTPKPEAGKP